ncbi:MAG: alpha/beta hydrolase [Anaerolineales bacterium]|nr:alpha/beta hydrolase [Anaerolineales bacterium]
MEKWQPYQERYPENTVIGDLRIWPACYSPQLNNQRAIYAWLPPGYHDTKQRYPVLYMHDGDNLFDARRSYSGEWLVDETMQQLSQQGQPAIIIGLSNQGNLRRMEYNPYASQWPEIPDGSGENYIRFLVETLKPFIDASFRTLPDRQHTGIAGSSMGGLISLYGFLTRPEVFGFCGALSTAYWFGKEGLLNTIETCASGVGKVYLDVGTEEGPTLQGWGYADQDLDRAYVTGVRRLHEALLEHGYDQANLMYLEETGAPHHESAWARRLPAALKFLLPKSV